MSWAMIAEVLARRLPPHSFEHTFELDYIDRWTPLQECPSDAKGARTAVLNDEIYLLGSDTSPYTQFRKYDPATDQWQVLKSATLDKRESVFQAVDGTLYSLGGKAASVQQYDPIEDSWLTLPDMLVNGNNAPAVSYNGETYYLANTQLRKYNPATNTWKILAACPQNATGAAVVVFEDKIHVVGSSSAPTRAHRRYDPATDSWEMLEDCPNGGGGCSAVVVGDEMYVVGPTTQFYKYNAELDAWTALSDCPNSANSVAVAAVHGEIFVVGQNKEPYGMVSKYVVENNMWYVLTDCPADARSSTAVVVNDEIYVKCNGEIFRKFSPQTNTWSVLQNLPVPVNYRSPLTFMDGVIYLWGYIPGSYAYYTFDIKNNRWSQLNTHIGTSAANGIGAAVDDKVYLLFGNKTCCFKPATLEWTSLADCPATTSKTSLAVELDGDIYILIADGNSTNLYKYTPELDAWTQLPQFSHKLGQVAVAVNGELYVMSATTTSPATAGAIYKFTPELRSWTEVSTRKLITYAIGVRYGEDIYLVSDQKTYRYIPALIEGFQRKTLARVEKGQRLFYDSMNHTAVLTLHGERLPYGETIIQEPGYLIADPLTRNADSIYGWID